jgi:hypothetical protein
VKNKNVKIELSIDEILLIMYLIRNAILDGKNKEVIAAELYDRLDKIISGF